MIDKDADKNQTLPSTEWRYRQDVLNTLFKLTIIITSAMAVAYLLVYVQIPSFSTLMLAVTFPLLPFMVWGCLHLLNQAKIQLALQLFITAGTIYITLVVLFMPSNFLLIGMMGVFVMVRISTFFDKSKNIVVFGVLWASLYLIAITLRDVLDIPDTELDGWIALFWNLVPVSIMVIFVLLDRTVTRYLAQALTRSETARHNLQAANEELKSFAYAVSHDIRAPLRAIHNYSDFLQEDFPELLEEGSKSYLNGLNQAVYEAEELVEDLLEFSRLGQQQVQLETVDLEQFFKTLFESLNLPSDVEITCPNNWPSLQSEITLLRQIFQNLILNAVKFNHSSPKCVELGWQTAGEENIEIFVRDNGIGIAPRYQNQIFQVFQRLHTKQEYEGTGIGLAIVKKAIDKLGGMVRIESPSEGGSTFFVTLPKS